MDATYEYLWAAGYDLPPEPKPMPAPRRGKKAAKAKRAKR